ncbi:MAG: hypothetical protein JSV86_12325 [Gemmatimonadota bacterium]|nr:MAG: hypothetical protein JSV86_12325 [Gemmatimonadota bacterium]
MPRVPLAAYGWMRRHSVQLVRLFAVLTVAALTALAGYTCHGLIGPPG